MESSAREEALRRAGTVALTRELGEGLRLLLRKEVELATEEVREDLRRGALAGGLASGAGGMLVAALCCALVALIVALSRVVPTVLLAGALALGFGLLGLALGMVAISAALHLRQRRALRQARETVGMFRRVSFP